MGTFYTENSAYLRGLCSGQYLWVHIATHPTCEDSILRRYLWVHMAKHLTCGNLLDSVYRGTSIHSSRACWTINCSIRKTYLIRVTQIFTSLRGFSSHFP